MYQSTNTSSQVPILHVTTLLTWETLSTIIYQPRNNKYNVYESRTKTNMHSCEYNTCLYMAYSHGSVD